jgi:phosphoglycerate kinase
MDYRTIDDLDFRGKRVIMRADFNVPTYAGRISEDTRIRQTIPTIKKLLQKGATQIVLMSHLGRPDGRVVNELRLNPVAKKLSVLLGMPVEKTDDCIDIDLPKSRVVLLENLRFHREEEDNYEFFAKKLAAYGDIFVNDAFGTMHRAHASTEAIAHFLPSCAGLLVEKELKVMGRALAEPERPFIAILGGAKVSDKIGVINNLLKKVDRLLIGGAMMFTFYKAQGWDVGKSLYEPDKVKLAKLMLHNEKLVLPLDVVVADKKDAKARTMVVDRYRMPADMMGLDIGPKAIEQFKAIIKTARTVVWNGPLGVFEIPEFAKGTNEVAKTLASIKGTTIVGGGDSDAAIRKQHLESRITHLSTGGGASLEFLEGKTLPGVRALEFSAKKYKMAVRRQL